MESVESSSAAAVAPTTALLLLQSLHNVSGLSPVLAIAAKHTLMLKSPKQMRLNIYWNEVNVQEMLLYLM